MNRDSASGMGLGILVGLLAGATLGMLFAPQSGRETRYLIRQRVGSGIDKARSVISRVRGGNSDDEDEELVEEP